MPKDRGPPGPLWAGRASRIVGRVPHLRRALLACAVLAAATLAACGTDAYPGEPPGALHTYVISEMKGFDPIQAGEETSSLLVINFYDQLYEFDYLARPFALTPCLADGMPEVSEDGLTYTIRLKQGVRFADDPCFPGGRGRELRASDVVFSFLRLMDARLESKGSWIFEGRIAGLDEFHEATKTATKDPARTDYSPAAGFPAVPGLVAVDDHTLRIVLTAPYPQLVWTFAMTYGSVYPPEAVARYGVEFMLHPVGTGPYLVDEYSSAQKLVLVRNPNYRKDTYPTKGAPGDAQVRGRLDDAGKALPLNDRVVVTVFKETQPMWLYFQRGFLDRVGVPKDNFDSAIDAATGRLRGSFETRGIELDKDPRLEVIYDLFNMQDPVVGKGDKARAVRRAISLAIDQEWAKHHLYNDRVSRVDGPVIEEFPEFDPAFRNPWKRGPDETRAQALDRARKVLADAGVDVRTLPPIEQDVQESTTDRQHFLAAQRDLAEIGIRLKAHTSTWQEMQERIDRGQVQMAGLSWGADYPEAQNFLQLFYGPNKPPGPNGANYQNPEFDRLYDQAASMQPSAERTALYRKMQDIVVDDCVWVVKYRRLQYTLRQPWTHGYRYNDLSSKYFKYVRVDDAARRAANERANAPALGPPLGFGLAVAGMALAMVGVARRTKRGW